MLDWDKIESLRLNLYKPVDNWYDNVNYAFNPRSILITENEFNNNTPRWGELFSYPYFEQNTDSTTDDSDWILLKYNFISGSEVGSALGKMYYKGSRQNDFIDYKTGKKVREFDCNSRNALDHGKNKEDTCGMLYSYQLGEPVFKFGFIPHKDKKWSFLGVSPDLIKFGYKPGTDKVVEIKCPFRRNIIDSINVDEVTYNGYEITEDVVVLMKEVMMSGNPHKYLTITNLPIEWSSLLDKCIYYYHQCQLQVEVLDIGEIVDFVQLGTFPNKFYLNKDLLTITHVQRDRNWISEHGNTLRKVWDEVLYQRRIHKESGSFPKGRPLSQPLIKVFRNKYGFTHMNDAIKKRKISDSKSSDSKSSDSKSSDSKPSNLIINKRIKYEPEDDDETCPL